MKCKNCGGDIKPGSKFCEFCGSSITVEMQKEQEQLNKKGCPSCGSTNVTFSRENQGEKIDKKGKQVMRQTVGVCRDCGYTWNAPSGVEGKKKRRTWLWVLGWIFIFPVPLTILMLRPTNKLDKRIRYGIVAAAWLVYLIYVGVNRSGGSKKESASNSPSVEYGTTISDLSVSQEEASKEVEELLASVSEEIETAVEATGEASTETSEVTATEVSEVSVEEKKEDSVLSNAVDPDLKAFLDSYEAFMDQYIEFLENYDASDFAMLTEYAKLLDKLNEFEEKADKYDSDTMSPADQAYYLEVMARIEYKLAKCAYGLN